MPTALNDGCNLTGVLDGVAGLYPACRFSYRLGGGFAHVKHGRSQQAPNEAEHDRLITEIIKEYLDELYVADDDGNYERFAHGPEGLAKLKAPIRMAIVDHILGWRRPVQDDLLPKLPTGSGS